MKARPLWQVSVAVRADADEAACGLLARWFGVPACAVHNARSGATTVSVFLQQRPRRRMLTDGTFGAALRALTGAGDKRSRLRVRRLPARDWAESWKRHFKPKLIGDKLLLKPGWSKRRPGAGQVAVVLDPGLSFGTGQHPTTEFCLREIVRHRPLEGRRAFLDVGTGSGILAIAAAKLGYAPVDGFDVDPVAVRVARANARRNRVLGRLRLWLGDAVHGDVPGGRRYDLVCANLLTPMLIAAAGRLAGCLQPGGRLVAAGILDSEFASVRTAFARVGLRLCRSLRRGQWRSGTFVRDRTGSVQAWRLPGPRRGQGTGNGQ